jgi:hypothetical protein
MPKKKQSKPELKQFQGTIQIEVIVTIEAPNLEAAENAFCNISVSLLEVDNSSEYETLLVEDNAAMVEEWEVKEVSKV